ncbi:dynactin subunit 1-like isoform X2 [Anguilla anguilla]|uniref:dynactin subunit 1-like isoform X2 n=1 Tax=Anguilla anguilla TaxID=7936 RepID=UPI0015A85F30|nr:dynactin subunit 1-like isoform X2 [Anguilla anguilla]
MDNESEKQRAAFFTPIEQETIIAAYNDYVHIFHKKSNTSAAAKERELAWKTIADRVNACNPGGSRRTWQQVKVKYKNIIQTANRKKAEARKTGGVPPPPPFSPGEEQGPSQNSGSGPVTDGIPGASSSEPATPQDTSAYIKDEDEEILTRVFTDGPTEQSMAPAPARSPPARSPPAVEPSTSRQHLSTKPVEELYKVHLERKIEKSDLEITHLKLQIRKTELETAILEHQLKEIQRK